MKIAILGWGSLIWDPKKLDFNEQIGWNVNGPQLPIEFARISGDGRLTLVITEHGTFIPTLYAISKSNNFEKAIENLKSREGTSSKYIGWYNRNSTIFYPEDFLFKENIKSWIIETDIDFVMWTNLPEKWITKTKKEINPKERITYLKELNSDVKEIAKEYIQKTPEQIQTKYRQLIKEELKW
ncbi:hypothetical protein [Myroides odoratimimus]|uniref:hypothetical protein n=1 Tax=Myroides odoratimimus TaxID=76832 RepID=UPI0025771F17|nr:hypothetical protein [Myroides odoratimimus]MDM1454880.1 hypothetical protein [Myroides odoratimimus]MDM1478602.1 hypothetical protein [Myroides odoratimimus]MDM1490950.1 hypothetical protein [Myroides odoratimimus]